MPDELMEQEVKQTAWDHLNSRTAEEALGHYEPDAIVACDGRLYERFEQFAEDTRAFYENLKEVELATWDNMQVQVLGDDSAVLTATVRWRSIDREGNLLNLNGVWTAVFVKRNGTWRIRARHESFKAYST